MIRKDYHLYKTIFDQTPISTQIFTPDGETVMVNKAWEKLWNLPFSEIKGYNILKDKQLVKTGTMPYIKKGFMGESVFLPVIKYEPTKAARKKGAVPFLWVQARLYPIRDSEDKITHLVLQHEDVTERRRAEEVKNRLAAIIEFSDDAIVSKNLDSIIMSWNKSAERLFGYTAKEAIGKHIKLIIPKSLISQEEEIITKIKKGEHIDHFETERKRKDGTLITVSLTISPIKDASGTVIGASKIARDITEKRKAEKDLQESEERFRSLTDSAPVGIFLTDKEGRSIFVNRKWLEFAGMTQKQAMGEGWAKALHPDDREKVHAEWKDALRTEREFNLEYRFKTKKGKITWLTGKSIALYDQNGDIRGYMGTVTDITARKFMENSLKESEERLRLALRAGEIGVWDWDIENNVLTWTENIYKIHDVDPKTFKVTMKNFQKLIHPDDRERIQSMLRDTIERGKIFAGEFRIVTAKGETRWVHTNAMFRKNEQNKVVRLLGATTDISLQKKIEQDKNDFLSMASHELKTPLTSMKIFIELLRSQLKDTVSEKPRYYLDRIQDQSARLTELTGDLLDVSRIETGKLRLKREKFIMDDLVIDTVESIQPSTNRHILEVVSSPKAQVYADRYRIYQVLVNLLTNAIKYSPKDTSIFINIKKEKKQVLVSVQDFGIGIKKSQLERVFDKLYQVSDPREKTYPGLGLGLYISKEIVERHNGKIWVASRPGKGSTFFFTIPVEK